MDKLTFKHALTIRNLVKTVVKIIYLYFLFLEKLLDTQAK